MENERNLIRQIQDYSEEIVVMAPTEGEKVYRVYANGGLICKLTYNDDNSVSVQGKMSEAYNKHINDSERFLSVSNALGRTVSSFSEELSGYLDLAIQATEHKFHNKERQYQTRLARLSRDSCVYNPGKKQWLIIDMEYTTSKEKYDGNYKPDYIVFDGESFGIVELKCNGNIGENFIKHIKDFNSMVSSDKYMANIKQFIARMEVLIEIGVIDESFRTALNEYKESYRSKKPSDIVWIGFLFIDEEGKSGHTKCYLNRFIEVLKSGKKFEVDVKIKHILPTEYEEPATRAIALIADRWDTIEDYLSKDR